MTGVLTGDIINSRGSKDPEKWLTPLKEVFSKITTSDTSWEVYRGDSFQVEIEDIYSTFLMAVLIKSTMRSIKGIDVRISIGIGEKTYEGKSISESNGSAFVNSGLQFEKLKQQKINLAIMTASETINKELNLYFKLALIAMDNWTTNSAEIIKTAIENPGLSQEELGDLIGIKQSAVSERIKRASFDEIMELDLMYRHKISML
ncbi:winged helix-turn-helix transcriptional regulator [Joostella atrarenae]|uniref:Winged helix-turn-helix transcriptional regulator n=1 Tax=Joostella atrarenae TaxID=679257 RepID=A0ABS9J4A8_9FLAO|nr:SatD family protein [Joostella atrarenae]MCF8715229.1 winged helix-turn-helix transcriptional regulator [Joostella atrarenae]